MSMSTSKSGRRSLRPVILGALASVLLVVVAACSPAGETKTSDTLFVNNNFCNCTSLDPQSVTVGAASALYSNALYSTLVTYEGSDLQNLQPNLAESWTVSDDNTTFTFKLRSGAKFADGADVTADDVVFTLKRFANIKGPLSGYMKFEDISTEGSDTVIITTATPTPSLPQLLTSPYLGILNSELAQANGATDAEDAATTDTAKTDFFTTQAAGSGPYMVESFDPTATIVLVANPNYWGDKPAFSKVIMSNVPAGTQLLNIQRDDFQIALDISPKDADTIDAEHASAELIPAPVTFYLQMSKDSAGSATTADPRIIEAVRLGIDYETLLDIAGPGSIQAPSLIPPGIAGALPESENASFDPDEAASIVQEAVADGVDPSFTLSFPTGYATQGVNFQQIAEAVAANLTDIGLTVNLDAAPISTWVGKLVAGETQSDISSWPLQFPDPSAYAAFNPGGSIALRAHWEAGSSPELEQAFSEASEIGDPAARDAAYQEASRLFTQAGTFMPLFYPGFVVAHTNDLEGVVFNPNVQFDLAAVVPAG